VILLADPDPKSRAELCLLLEAAGHEVAAVATGTEAAAVLMERTPRLIILDLDLKWLSGRQLIDVLRRNHHTAHIPIVAMAMDTEPLDGIPTLVRPVTARDLIDCVERFAPGNGHRPSYM
jgi:CheY-like chemotaxis protein